MRDQLERVHRRDAESIRPSKTVRQHQTNIRTFRRYSSSLSREGFSKASASGSYTARRPWTRRGKAEVVAERVLDVVAAPHRVDGAVAAGDRAKSRLLLALPELVAPVRALAVRPVGLLELEASADVGDLGSAKLRASLRSASGAQVALASEKATSSDSVPRTARSSAGRFPSRGARRRLTRGSRAAISSTISSVRSSEASEATTTSSCSGG